MDNLAIFGHGGIMISLAEKAGQRLPTDIKGAQDMVQK